MSRGFIFDMPFGFKMEHFLETSRYCTHCIICNIQMLQCFWTIKTNDRVKHFCWHFCQQMYRFGNWFSTKMWEFASKTKAHHPNTPILPHRVSRSDVISPWAKQHQIIIQNKGYCIKNKHEGRD